MSYPLRKLSRKLPALALSAGVLAAAALGNTCLR